MHYCTYVVIGEYGLCCCHLPTGNSFVNVILARYLVYFVNSPPPSVFVVVGNFVFLSGK